MGKLKMNRKMAVVLCFYLFALYSAFSSPIVANLEVDVWDGWGDNDAPDWKNNEEFPAQDQTTNVENCQGPWKYCKKLLSG